MVKLQWCIQQYKCWQRWIKETLQKYHDFSVSKQHFKFSIVLIDRKQNLFPGHQQNKQSWHWMKLLQSDCSLDQRTFYFLNMSCSHIYHYLLWLDDKIMPDHRIVFFFYVLFVSSWFVKASQRVVWSKQPVCVCVFVCVLAAAIRPLWNKKNSKRPEALSLSFVSIFALPCPSLPCFMYACSLSPFPSLSVFPPTSHSHIHPLPTSTRSPRSTLQAISRRVTQDKSASPSSCIFRARTQARVSCGAGTGLMRSISLSLTWFHLKAS